MSVILRDPDTVQAWIWSRVGKWSVYVQQCSSDRHWGAQFRDQWWEWAVFRAEQLFPKRPRHSLTLGCSWHLCEPLAPYKELGLGSQLAGLVSAIFPDCCPWSMSRRVHNFQFSASSLPLIDFKLAVCKACCNSCFESLKANLEPITVLKQREGSHCSGFAFITKSPWQQKEIFPVNSL